ncbi:MAG: hypothetical protein GY950_08190, partial [bacterium]|nr:hypothetical protein [bacterium]
VLGSDKKGNYRLWEVQKANEFEFSFYYQLKYPGLEALEKVLNGNRVYPFKLDECEVHIPWDYSFLNRVTGLDLTPDSFLEMLLNEKRLQLLIGLLYRLSDREINFISALEPGLGTWKKIYQSNARLKGFFLLSHALRVKDGRLLLPGGETAAPFWTRTAGADPYKNPGRFLENTATMHKGKLNYLFTFSFFLPEDVRKAVFFNYDPVKMKTIFKMFRLSGGEEIGNRGFTLPGLRDFGFFTLLYALKTRDGRIHFPGGITAWADAVGAKTKDLQGILSALTGSSGGKDKIKRFVSIYNKFYHRPVLLTPEVIRTLYRHYNDYNVLVDFLETIPIRKPGTVLNMIRWVKAFEASGPRGREKAMLTGVFQSLFYFLAHHARYPHQSPDGMDYDRVVSELLDIPFTGAGAYDRVFFFFKNSLGMDLNAPDFFMQFLLGGLGDKVVFYQNQLYVVKAQGELQKEMERILKRQQTCELSELVQLNRCLDTLQGDGPWGPRMGKRMLTLYENLPHPAVITARDKRAVPLAWQESRESALVTKFFQSYSAGKVLKMLNRLVELKTGGGSAAHAAHREEMKGLIQKIKKDCLLTHLQHYLVTCAYAAAIKNAKPRIFLNHNFTRLHDFYSSWKRTPWNSSDVAHHLGQISCYHLRGGLSRLNITLGYPYSDYMWGRSLRYYRPLILPILTNNLDFYPYPSVSRVRDYVGRMVLAGKEQLEKARWNPELRRELEEKAALLTAGYHYRNVMAFLDGKRDENSLYFSELMRLGEMSAEQGNRGNLGKEVTADLDKMGSVYYHSFGTLLPHRYRLFPQPLSHFFASKWLGGEMIDELKIKTAYIAYLKKTPPELLGFLMFRYLNYTRRILRLDYKNEYPKIYHMYDIYNYLHMNRILKKLKKQGILRLK